MSKIKSSDIANVLDLLVAYLHSTSSVAVAIKETGDTFPQYKDSLNLVAEDILVNGSALTVALKKHDIFPVEVTILIGAGSESGKLTEVLPEVSRSLKFLTTVSSGMISAVAMQGLLLLSMITAAPFLLMLVAGQTKKKEGILKNIEVFITHVRDIIPAVDFLYPIIVIAFGISAFFYKPLRVSVISALSIIPMIRIAVTNYQTGSWCRYIALMTSAGIPLNVSERLLRGSLQPLLAEAFTLLVDKQKNGWEEISNFNQFDPRTRIPKVVMAFLRSGGQSGQLDKQLNLAADYQLQLARVQFESLTKYMAFFAMLLVAAMVTFMGLQVYVPS
jgi:type II secretory pathway component PulF